MTTISTPFRSKPSLSELAHWTTQPISLSNEFYSVEKVGSGPKGRGEVYTRLNVFDVTLMTRNGAAVLAKCLREAAYYFRPDAGNDLMFESYDEMKQTLQISPNVAPAFNCHGHSFANDLFLISSEEVEKILKREYRECKRDRAHVGIFMDVSRKNIAHSAPMSKGDFISAKAGIRPLIFSPLTDSEAAYQDAGEAPYHPKPKYYVLK